MNTPHLLTLIQRAKADALKGQLEIAVLHAPIETAEDSLFGPYGYAPTIAVHLLFPTLGKPIPNAARIIGIVTAQGEYTTTAL